MGVSGRGDGGNLSEETVFSLLSNRRRRFALHALREADERVPLGRLAERVAGWEEGVPPERLDAAERKSVYTSLQQFHLPKMDDAGVVEFDDDRGVVETTPAVERLDLYVEVVRGDDVPWHGYYLGLSAVAASLAVALWVDAEPFALLPDEAWLVAVVVAFAFSACAHATGARQRRIGACDLPEEARR